MVERKSILELREKVEIDRARKVQFETIIEALGGRNAGWIGFTDSQEVVNYLHANRAERYHRVKDIADLCEKLGINKRLLEEFSQPVLDAARAADVEADRILTEHASATARQLLNEGSKTD